MGYNLLRKSASACGLVLLLGLAGAGPGSAALSPFAVLNRPAIAASDPEHVLLISIAAAGHRLVAVGNYGVIIYSDDNGRTWRQASVPISVTLTTVAFATPKDGWAAGDYGAVLHSTDGGASWQLQITGTQVNQMMTTSAGQYAAANPTSDMADRATRRANIFMQAGPDKPFLTILAIDPQTAIVFGAYRMCIKTTDGGKTWADCSLNIADPISHNLYDVIRAGPSLYISGEMGEVYNSSDQGNSFAQVTSPGSNTLFGILTAKDGTLLTFGVAGAMFRSSDQGKTWTQVNMPTQSNLTSGVVLKSGVVLVTAESGNVFVSSDNGMTFTAGSGNQGMALFDVIQADNGDIVFVGDSGVRVVPGASLKT